MSRLGGTAMSWCYETLPEVSRTFALTVSELEEPMSREICLSYLACRVADTVEDDERIPPGETARLLRVYDRALDPSTGDHGRQFRRAVDEWIPASPGPDWELVAHTPRVLRQLAALPPEASECIRPPVRELVTGLADFLTTHAGPEGLRIGTVDELEEYCWYAAGTVGDLVTGLATRDASPAVTASLEADARAFGLLLQLVNVAKDAGTDYREEDTVYLPATWLSEAGVAASDVGDPDAAEAVAPVVRRVAGRAETYLDGAQSWLDAMPEDNGNTLSAWGIPFLLAVGTLRELDRRPADALRGEVKVSRAEVGAVIEAFEDGAGAADLGSLRETIRERPLATD